MTEETTKRKPPPRNKMQQRIAQELRDKHMVELAINGASVKEIADKLGVTRTTVYRSLTNNDVKEILKTADNRIHNLIGKCIDTVEQALDNSDEDMNNGAKVALAVLKSVGVIKDKAEIAHTFPVPTIIRRRNGEEVVLGSTLPEEKAS